MRSNRRPLLLVVLTLASCRRSIVPQQKPSAPEIVSAAAGAATAATSAERPATTDIIEAPAARGAVSSPAARSASTCVVQPAQPFLVDAHLRKHTQTTAAAQVEWSARLQRSIRYRTEQYGYYTGFGSRAWNPRPLESQLRLAKFKGLSVLLHERVIPALQCVEQAIERDCGAAPYRPRSLAGARQTNTYFSGDVSNHVYGIALDIDPDDNPCCNCLEPWRSNPRCRGKKSDWQRMAMPECWVTAFEQYGFYWLGHDELKDTMHFEFLGDPSKLVATLAP